MFKMLPPHTLFLVQVGEILFHKTMKLDLLVHPFSPCATERELPINISHLVLASQ